MVHRSGYHQLEHNDDLARCFIQQFQYNIDIIPDRSSLANMRKKTTENFREYAIRWREQAARVKPPMKESEMIGVFLQAQKPDYFHYLLSAVGKTFAEVKWWKITSSLEIL